MWYQDTVVKLLIKAMINKGCAVIVPPWQTDQDGLTFIYNGVSVFVEGRDISNALHAAYRVEWEPTAIVKRFERYLIDLHNKRLTHEDMGIAL